VVRLLAGSLYLERAGLDWQGYYAEIEEDFQAARYSQHAAAFLLTLLPNIENLRLPKRWKPLGATDKLIEAAVPRAKQSHLPHDRRHKSMASKNPYGSFATTLGTVELVSCCIDETVIAEFLKQTTRLRKLRYSHTTKGYGGAQDWNICKFVTAIEREAGSHLEVLSVTYARIARLKFSWLGIDARLSAVTEARTSPRDCDV
jgi:hypothetical protein